uniref:Uncharacterized protein n=1 Tax=Arundo donax TaxID=35708 RepID=A0A0A8ZEM7_ARUDO
MSVVQTCSGYLKNTKKCQLCTNNSWILL